ncbi:hypothetical protein F2P56_036591 [Juglans regia]|nr:hypothetical protein F2P56_036591 [Juglans regia]
MRIGISGLWERLDFPGQGEVDPEELELEIEKKRGQYQSNLQPYYRQCLKNEVKMEVKLAVGICPTRLTVQEAQNSNVHWVVLDSHLKKYKEYIRQRISSNLAVMKGKDTAILVTLKASGKDIPEEESSAPLPVTEIPCSYPLSWRGSPRAIDQSELEAITNNFADENIIMEANGMKYYHGMLQDAPVLVECFIETDENFWSMLEILSRVRHRNILNIVGYLSTGAPKSLLYDNMCMGTVDLNLQCDNLAMDFGWKARWCVALEIGASLRYLHEECVDGPIVHLSVCSAHVLFSSGYSTMLVNFRTAKWLTDDVSSQDDSPAKGKNLEEDEHLSVDIHDYGIFLLELITGKRAPCFQAQGNGQKLVDWAIPLLQNGSISQLMDPRLTETCDTKVVQHMANAALCCLKNAKNRRHSMSEVLAVVRGDELAVSKYGVLLN